MSVLLDTHFWIWWVTGAGHVDEGGARGARNTGLVTILRRTRTQLSLSISLSRRCCGMIGAPTVPQSKRMHDVR